MLQEISPKRNRNASRECIIHDLKRAANQTWFCSVWTKKKNKFLLNFIVQCEMWQDITVNFVLYHISLVGCTLTTAGFKYLNFVQPITSINLFYKICPFPFKLTWVMLQRKFPCQFYWVKLIFFQRIQDKFVSDDLYF